MTLAAVIIDSIAAIPYASWGSHIVAQGRTKSTRKRNTPENAGIRPFRESAFSGVLRFRVLFVLL